MAKKPVAANEVLWREIKRRKLSFRDLVLPFAWCVIATALLCYFPHLGDRLNFRVYDLKMRLATPPDRSPVLVHADIDDDARTKYKEWPWDRAIAGEIIGRLSQMGAKAVVFDIMYSIAGPTKDGDAKLFEAVKQAGNVVSAFTAGITSDKEARLDSEKLEEITKKRADSIYDRAWATHVPRVVDLLRINELRASYLPLDQLIENSAALGHISATADIDGIHRRVPLLIQLADRCVPSLGLAALMIYWGAKSEDVSFNGKGYLEIKRPSDTIRIPVDSQCRIPVNWGKIWDETWETIPHYSVTDVLSDEPDPSRASRYKGKIVVIGVTITGGTDVGVTPLDPQTPLSRIHSHVISTILTGNFIREIPALPYLVVLAVVAAVGFCVAAIKIRLKFGLIALAAICTASLALSYAAFALWRYEIPLAEFFFVFVPAAVGSLSTRTFSVELQASRATKALEKYLSPEFLNMIVSKGVELDLSTRRKELTILFADIEGFSTMSEAVEVEYINQILNDFFERMTRVVFQYQGTVDKFLGDGLLAFFGDPLPIENHALAAVNAALKMQKEMAEMDREWSSAGIAGLDRGLRIRIGINSGLVIVGNVGSSRRLEYTVIGSAVNIASRLQSLAPPGGVIMTGRTWAGVRNEVPFRAEGPANLRVKGINRDISVYRIQPEQIAGLK